MANEVKTEQPIYLKDKQTVYTTAKIQAHFKTVGTAVELHPKQAEAWIKEGKATAGAPGKKTKAE